VGDAIQREAVCGEHRNGNGPHAHLIVLFQPMLPTMLTGIEGSVTHKNLPVNKDGEPSDMKMSSEGLLFHQARSPGAASSWPRWQSLLLPGATLACAGGP
jgi:hypothetical protein